MCFVSVDFSILIRTTRYCHRSMPDWSDIVHIWFISWLRSPRNVLEFCIKSTNERKCSEITVLLTESGVREKESTRDERKRFLKHSSSFWHRFAHGNFCDLPQHVLNSVLFTLRTANSTTTALSRSGISLARSRNAHWHWHRRYVWVPSFSCFFWCSSPF